MLAALASAAMPQITVAAVRGGYQANATDDRNGIDYAIVQDAAGKPYDVYVSDTDAGRKRLSARVRAAQSGRSLIAASAKCRTTARRRTTLPFTPPGYHFCQPSS